MLGGRFVDWVTGEYLVMKDSFSLESVGWNYKQIYCLVSLCNLITYHSVLEIFNM